MKNNSWTQRMDLAYLEKEFREEEIKQVIWELRPDKAPGPNGFPMFFFKTFWTETKLDLILLLREVHRKEVCLDKINF